VSGVAVAAIVLGDLAAASVVDEGVCAERGGGSHAGQVTGGVVAVADDVGLTSVAVPTWAGGQEVAVRKPLERRSRGDCRQPERAPHGVELSLPSPAPSGHGSVPGRRSVHADVFRMFAG